MRKILITGATGFIGRHLIAALPCCFSDVEILTVNRNTEKAENLFSNSKCTHVLAADYNAIIAFNPDIVIHLATMSTSSNDSHVIKPMLEANIEFGVNLLSVLSKCSNMKLFVNTGTFAEYRLGTEIISNAYLYSATKSAFRCFVDYYSNLSGFKYINAVPYTVYGGSSTAKKIIDYIRDSLNASVPVKMTAGEQILDFIHVKDVVSFFVKIIDNLQNTVNTISNGENFYVGTGVGTKIRDLAEIIEKAENKKCNIEWGSLPYRSMDIMYAVAPVEKNNGLINWKSQISIEEGVKL